ncbi:PIN domain-containing protein [Saccharomonospora sp. NPDC006951]
MARPDPYHVAYFDSCVFTRLFTRGRGWPLIQNIVDAADAGRFQLCTSMFSLVECLSQPPSARPDIGLEARILDHLDTDRLVLIEFSRSVALRARELHLTKKFRIGDAIQIASACEARADVLFTTDEDDFPIGQRFEGIWIDTPYLPGDRTLFDADEESS